MRSAIRPSVARFCAPRQPDSIYDSDRYAAAHPEVVSAVMLSASLDVAAQLIASALVIEDTPPAGNGILRASRLPR